MRKIIETFIKISLKETKDGRRNLETFQTKSLFNYPLVLVVVLRHSTKMHSKKFTLSALRLKISYILWINLI